MPLVFNRHQEASHPWSEALNEMLQSGDPTDQAIARNLMHDHRVSLERETFFKLYVAQPCTAQALKDGLFEFFTDRIRSQKQPDFLENHNAGNFIDIQKLGEETDFVRVIDLHNLKLVFQFHREQKEDSPFDDFIVKEDGEHIPEREKQKTLEHFLNKNLEGNDDQRRAFIESVIAAMNVYLDEYSPYNPTWVTTWDSFENYVKSPAICWSEAVGVYKDLCPRWIIVLRYKPRDVKKIVRPTQLDAGSYPYHFPSPPQSSLENGGHPMNLDLNSPNLGKLAREYIHPQIKHDITHWENAGSLCEKTNRLSSPDLAIQRETHHKRLTEQHGAEVKTWLPVAS